TQALTWPCTTLDRWNSGASRPEDRTVNNEIAVKSPTMAPDDPSGFWWRFRLTFGPALVGLVGGSLTIGIAWSAMAPLLRNVANTYAKYPSVEPPWLARDISLPGAILIPLLILGVAAPFSMGLVTAWLVRSKDR